MWKAINRAIGQIRSQGTMNSVCARDDVWQTAFVCRVIVFVNRLMVTIREHCQTAAFGLYSECASSRTFLVDRNRESWSVVRIRLGYRVKMFLLD